MKTKKRYRTVIFFTSDKNEIHRNIRIMIKPDSISIDASGIAVFVNDMENDFGAKGGMFIHVCINISMIKKVIDSQQKF